MRNTPRLEMIKLAADNQGRDPIAKAIAECTEGEFVSPRLLKDAISEAGYEIKETPRKVLTRIEVFKDEVLIAYGESQDAADALLQAVAAYLRGLPAPLPDRVATVTV